MTDTSKALALTDDERLEVRQWLRYPRGRYAVDRASQLSGVPRTTIYDWNKNGLLVPDFHQLKPMQWSYRDLVLIRLFAWLRSTGMARPKVAERVAAIRDELAVGPDDVTSLRSDGRVVIVGEEGEDRNTGQQVLRSVAEFVSEFDLTTAVDANEFSGRSRLWGPNLVHPTTHTAISPWVMAGDPCVRLTRIPTASLHALHLDRGLDTAAIVPLYPGITAADVADAIGLEQRLRSASPVAA